MELGEEGRRLIPFVGLASTIGLFVAAELAVSNWMVKLLSGIPAPVAASMLALFWAGMVLGRALSNWVADRFDAFAFTLACIALSSGCLTLAVVVPVTAVRAVLFGLVGIFFGPIYPMVMAIGGDLYPRRLAALSGGLSAAAIAGSIVYPPLMGMLAGRVGLSAGMVGAALLGIPMSIGLLVARRCSDSAPSLEPLVRAVAETPAAQRDTAEGWHGKPLRKCGSEAEVS
jgi:fucose permease